MKKDQVVKYALALVQSKFGDCWSYDEFSVSYAYRSDKLAVDIIRYNNGYAVCQIDIVKGDAMIKAFRAHVDTIEKTIVVREWRMGQWPRELQAAALAVEH